MSKTSPMMVEGEDFYMEGGMLVFTPRYHLRRGYCCGSGCRHCPFVIENEVETKQVETTADERSADG